MTKNSTFFSYLNSIGIFNMRQHEDFTKLKCKDEEEQVFRLADFFKSLTYSDHYDLSLRLYLYWKKVRTTSDKSFEEQSEKLKKFTELMSKNIKKSREAFFERIKKMVTAEKANKKSNVTYNKYMNTLKDSTLKSSTCLSSYQSEPRKDYVDFSTDEYNYLEDQRVCTFQPNTRENSHPNLEDFNSVEQYREDNKTIDISRDQYNFQKSKTFNTSASKLSTSVIKTEPCEREKTNNKAFDRLYKDGEHKKLILMENLIKKQEIELKDCTFKPCSSFRSESPGSTRLIQDKVNKLYNLHFEKERNLAKKRLESSDKEIEGCTFKPKILTPTKSAQNLNASSTADRLLDWEREKKKKLEEKIIEKERQETSMASKLSRSRDITDDSGIPRHEKLFKDSEVKKTKQESLERKILKEIGASFTPKINAYRHASPSAYIQRSMISNSQSEATINVSLSAKKPSLNQLPPRASPPRSENNTAKKSKVNHLKELLEKKEELEKKKSVDLYSGMQSARTDESRMNSARKNFENERKQNTPEKSGRSTLSNTRSWKVEKENYMSSPLAQFAAQLSETEKTLRTEKQNYPDLKRTSIDEPFSLEHEILKKRNPSKY